MSEITLSVLRSPEGIVLGQRRATGGEISLGRNAECDWQLPDPDRVVSGRHCVLEYQGGGWQVRDVSTNGTFVNHGAAPVGRDQVRPLMDGDRLRLGPYEIEVRIAEAEAPAWGASPTYGADPSGMEALPSNPFATAMPGFGGASVPANYNPLADDDPPMADQPPATAEVFLPRPVEPMHRPAVPQDREPDRQARATEAPSQSANPFVEAPDPAPQPVARLPDPPPAAWPPATPSPAAPPRVGDAAASLAALLDGAGVPPSLVAGAQQDPEAALRAAGALLRAAIAGMRALLIARADVKREFRIEQTMLRSTHNNPLKFAPDDERALAALLDPRTPALSAMEETVGDLTAHQVATLAATQAAARALLARLAPGPLEAEDRGGGLLPGAREKRLWEAYKRRHALVEEQFEDDFDSAFGKEFARAYEKATGRRDD